MQELKKQLLAKNFIWLIICIFIPILLLNVYYITYWSSDMKQQEIEKDAKFLSLIGLTLDTILNDINQLISLLEFDNEFSSAVEGLIEPDGNLSPSRYIYLNSVMENTFRAFLAKPYIRSAYFYHEKNDKFIFTTEGIRNLNEMDDIKWLNSYRETSSVKNYWAEVRMADIRNSPTGQVEMLSLFRKVPIFVTQPGQGVGVIVLNLETKYFSSLIDNIPDSTDKTIFITDGARNVLYKNAEVDLSNYLAEEDLDELSLNGHMVKSVHQSNYLISYAASKHYDWKYISIMPINKLTQRLDVIKRINALIVIASLLIGIVLAYRYTVKNYKPVHTLLNIINHYKEGKDISNFQLTKNDEFGYITLHIIRNFIEKNEIQNSLTENMLLQRESELFALQSQINPHFLYNMLDAINWEAIERLGKDNPVSNLLLQLSANLRYVTDHSRSMVTMAEDLEYLEKYVYMQQILKDNLFAFEMAVEDGVLSGLTMKLLIQPIVENSIKHGMAVRQAGGQIRLSVRRTRSDLEIRIIDNGGGIDKEKLRQIQAELDSAERADSIGGLGIRNIHQRVRLKYGSGYGLKVRSKRGWGTVVVITIPYIDS